MTDTTLDTTLVALGSRKTVEWTKPEDLEIDGDDAALSLISKDITGPPANSERYNGGLTGRLKRERVDANLVASPESVKRGTFPNNNFTLFQI